MEKKQTGRDFAVQANTNGVYDNEKERKAREKAKQKYTGNDPFDVINNPYDSQSQYIEDARELKFYDIPEECRNTFTDM